ncbi:calcium-independent phospholipase A2-gamma-like isoform X2 [Neocloeon triangulifer]|nr:calcium-independent phospholipase A2-gamma-like isoform X2 [Neocloeon triangulifer]XP_059474685.1 calcium-independent phospholipase A2-gamma-like isoform X2 [Neocloeon triangulifer]
MWGQLGRQVVRAAVEQGLLLAVAARRLHWPRPLSSPNRPKEGPGVNDDLPQEGHQGTFSLPNIFSSLAHNLERADGNTTVAGQPQVVPEWKLKRTRTVSKLVVEARTRSILTSIATAESVTSKLQRIDDLTEHLRLHPTAKSYSVKHGGMNTLLRMRASERNEMALAAIREALAMMGHTDGLSGRGIRILSMDGGGTRGVMVIELLRKLEALTGRRVCEMFDFICGVSTGAIMACLFGPHKKNLDDCAQLYKEISVRIFTRNNLLGASKLLWDHSYYDTQQWEQLLQNHVGTIPLIRTARDPLCPKMAAVSTVVNQAEVMPYVFRNYELPDGVPALYTGGSRHQLWEAARASAAAPSYFGEFRTADLLHQDGGVLVNNPTAIAIHEAKLLWPGEALQCVVSFGTGRCHPLDLAIKNAAAAATNGATGADTYSSWKQKFTKILESATDTEAVHNMLHDLLPNDVYFRFNPYVKEVSSMFEMRPEKLQELEGEAALYARRNDEKFRQVAATLTQPRTLVQRSRDWVKRHTSLLTSAKP